MLFFLLACAFKQHHGLLINDDSHLGLVDIGGQEYSLHFGDDEKYLAPLQGVIVRVEGPKVMRHIWVADWKIVDGGDGSAPFLGVLYRQGVQWMINDVQSGAQLILDAEFDDWKEGEAVLIVGYIAGAHRVRVVSYRMLGQTETTD